VAERVVVREREVFPVRQGQVRVGTPVLGERNNPKDGRIALVTVDRSTAATRGDPECAKAACRPPNRPGHPDGVPTIGRPFARGGPSFAVVFVFLGLVQTSNVVSRWRAGFVVLLLDLVDERRLAVIQDVE